MKTRLFSITALILILSLGSLWTAAAQAPEPPGRSYHSGSAPAMPAPARARGAPLAHSALAGEAGPQGAEAPNVALGQPGLSFRYVQTFGITEEPYIADTTHINRPWGLFIDDSDNLYVTEERGFRVLRYTSVGASTLALGRAGMCYTGDYVFCSPQDVALDRYGNMWVADGNRVVEYNASGTFLRQQPATDPWVSGNDNERFENVHGIAFDSAGRMYVSDTDNHRIQIFAFSGGVPVYSATIGVTDTPGSDNGHFDSPYRLAMDGSDRLYVVDRGNNRVQRCTFSGSWSCSTLDGGLNDPQGIAVDGGDNVYIADTDNGRIRKCSVAGACSDFVTDAYWLYDLAADSTGNVYGAAAWEAFVARYDSSGSLAGAFVGVEGVPYLTDGYHYNGPRIAIDGSGNMILTEESGQRLLKLDRNGTPLWAVGVPGVDSQDNEHFAYPHGVAVDKDGRIYVADGCRVQMYSGGGVYVATLGTGCGTGDYQFNWAAGVAVDDNNYIYVADYPNHRVQVYNANRVFVGRIGATGECSSANDRLCTPIGIEVDSGGNIYVADGGNCRVQKFNSSRVYQMTFGTTGSCTDSLSDISAEDVTVDTQGRVYVSEWAHDRVQVFDSNGAYLTTIGGASGANTGQFRFTSGVALDSAGNVYVTDGNNGRVQKFAPGVPGWRQVNINGFGDRSNSSVHALEAFDGQLYAGAENYETGAQIWRTADAITWTAVSSPGFGSAYTKTNAIIFDLIEFDGQLYAGTGTWEDDGVPGQIWRSDNGTTWTQVVDDGFGNVNNVGITSFGIFSGALYATTYNSVDGLEIWRSDTGDSDDWEGVAAAGFGGGSQYRVGTGLSVFNGYLYAAVEADPAAAAQIWRTNDGVTWIQANTDGFGDIDNDQTGGFAAFGGYLYVGTRNDTTGAQLYRSNNGTTWTQMISDGFGDRNNYKMESPFAFGGYLYAGTENDVTGIEIWRTADGATWNQVIPDGFGDGNNRGTLWSNATVAFNNHLYIGTYWNYGNGGEVWMKTLTADFTATPTSGAPPLIVHFSNTSGGDFTTSQWDFGDGGTSTETSPTHTYTAAGTYTVTLTVGDGTDTSTVTRTSYIRSGYSIYLPLTLRNYDPLLYDDFNDPAYDGGYNPALWEFWPDNTSFEAHQQNGVMVLGNALHASGGQAILVSRRPLLRSLQELGLFEARLKIGEDRQGGWSSMDIRIHSDDVGGHAWFTRCWLGGFPSNSQAHVNCTVSTDSSGGWQDEYLGPGAYVEANQWHTLRIEADPVTANLRFYLDGALLGSHTPQDAASLAVSNLWAGIVWDGRSNTTSTRYVDDVRITPAQ